LFAGSLKEFTSKFSGRRASGTEEEPGSFPGKEGIVSCSIGEGSTTEGKTSEPVSPTLCADF
jgi:hypothetical protein